jgi:hypothetical protein
MSNIVEFRSGRHALMRGRQPAYRPKPISAPLTDWQRRFLASLSRWPLALSEGQRRTLTWIARGDQQ